MKWNLIFLLPLFGLAMAFAIVFCFHTYMANHPGMAQRMADKPMAGYPIRVMTLTSPVTGIVSGLVLGLFAFLATKLVKKTNP